MIQEPEKLVSKRPKSTESGNTARVRRVASRPDSGYSALRPPSRSPSPRPSKTRYSGPREFTSTFNHSSKQVIAASALTSHELRSDFLPKPRILPEYTSRVGRAEHNIRWSADNQTSFPCEPQPIIELHDYNCWCEECTAARRRHRVTPPMSSGIQTSAPLTCNQCTMTAQLLDSGCGSFSALAPTQHITVSTCESSNALNSAFSSRPPSILKRSNCSPSNLSCFEKSWLDKKVCEYEDVSMRNNYDDSLSYSITEPPKNYEEQMCPLMANRSRKMLYNEGISDSAANLCMLHKEYEPTSYQQGCEMPFHGMNYIPYSHKHGTSKYHRDCSNTRVGSNLSKYHLQGKDEGVAMVPRPHRPETRKAVLGAYERRAVCSSRPRKVLQSEAIEDTKLLARFRQLRH